MLGNKIQRLTRGNSHAVRIQGQGEGQVNYLQSLHYNNDNNEI